jgi:uncharacterized membrane protein
LSDTGGITRLAFFADAVFAVSMVSLATMIPRPDLNTPASALHDSLMDRLPEIVGFFFCFAVLGIFWLEHRRVLAAARSHGLGFLWLNLLFLACIGVALFPSGLLARPDWVPLGVAFYAGWACVTTLVLAGLWATAGRVPRGVWVLAGVFALGALLAKTDVHLLENRFPLSQIFWLGMLPAAAASRR